MKKQSIKILALLCTLLGSSMTIYAQREDTEQSTRDNQNAPSRVELSPRRRLSQRPAGDIFNHFGFSLGVLGWYDSNISGTTPKEGLAGINPNPRVFFNFNTRKSVLHLDYGYLYRHYPSKSSDDSQRHDGSVEFIYQLSRYGIISFQDAITSSPNDILSRTNPGMTYPSSGNQQIFYDQKTMFQNNLSGQFTYQPPRSRNNFMIGTSYFLYRFESQPDQNRDSFNLQLTDNFKITKQWFVVGNLSQEWINSANSSRDGTIMRFTGGLAYRPNKNWNFSFSAGGERVGSGSNNATYNTNASYTTKLNQFSIQYSRQTGYQIGLVDLNRSHSLTGSFDRQLNSRTSVNMEVEFYRTNTPNYGNINSVGGGVGLDYAFRSNLTATVSGHYVYLRSSFPQFNATLHTDRYILYAGLQYHFPSLRRQPRN
jgi:hypothetical protein